MVDGITPRSVAHQTKRPGVSGTIAVTRWVFERADGWLVVFDAIDGRAEILTYYRR